MKIRALAVGVIELAHLLDDRGAAMRANGVETGHDGHFAAQFGEFDRAAIALGDLERAGGLRDDGQRGLRERTHHLAAKKQDAEESDRDDDEDAPEGGWPRGARRRFFDGDRGHDEVRSTAFRRKGVV